MFLRAGERQLHYQQVGRGEPLLILHGLPGFSHLYLLPHIAPLADSFTLYFLDFSGHGYSQDPVHSLTVDALVEDVEALRAHLGLPALAVLGHSSGGVMAQLYASRFPDRVSRLILVGTGATLPSFARNVLPHMGFRERLGLAWLILGKGLSLLRGRTAAFQNRLVALMARSYYKHEPFRETVIRGYQHACVRDCSGFRSLTREFARLDLRRLDRSHTRPTLILCGDADRAFGHVQDELQSLYPHAEFKWMNAGHDPFVEDSAAFLEAITQFLNRTAPQKAPATP